MFGFCFHPQTWKTLDWRWVLEKSDLMLKQKWCQSTHSFSSVSEELFIKIHQTYVLINIFLAMREELQRGRGHLWACDLQLVEGWSTEQCDGFYHHWSGLFSVFISFTERLLILTICVRIRRLCFHYTSKCNMHSKTTLMKEKSTVAVWSCVYMQMTMKSIKADIISK